MKAKPIAGILLVALCMVAGPLAAQDATGHRHGDLSVAFSGSHVDPVSPPRNERRRGWRGARGCATVDAIGQAAQNGLRPSLFDINRRRVVLEGHGRFGWGRMVFANTPGCPLILR